MDYSDWYRELEQETKHELWGISLNCTLDFTTSVAEWREFLFTVAKIRARKTQGKHPITTYAWHDEQACQLRFATADCTPAKLPFGCAVELQETPDSIIVSWLSAPDYIPWEQLKEVVPNEQYNEDAIPPLRVWAIRHKEV